MLNIADGETESVDFGELLVCPKDRNPFSKAFKGIVDRFHPLAFPHVGRLPLVHLLRRTYDQTEVRGLLGRGAVQSRRLGGDMVAEVVVGRTHHLSWDALTGCVRSRVRRDVEVVVDGGILNTVWKRLGRDERVNEGRIFLVVQFKFKAEVVELIVIILVWCRCETESRRPGRIEVSEV